MFDKSANVNIQLFLAICQQLSTLGIISSSDFLDELASTRSIYKKVRGFFHVQHKAFKELMLDAVVVINSNRIMSAKDSHPIINESLGKISRLNEFEFCHVLGKGAFGTVYQTRNHLEGIHYGNLTSML